MEHEFLPDTSFTYNQSRKKIFGYVLILIILLLAGFIITYYFVLKHIDFFLINWINSITANVMGNISQGTIIGALYAALFGGLFVVFIPMEAVFLNFLKANNPYILLILIYNLGFLISYTINYYIGRRFANLSMKIIGAEKFYKVKSKINKYGGGAIFLFNVIPLLPSQPVSVIIGVFKYNRTKFYIYFLLGQLIKYSAITIGYIYIF